MNDLLAHGFVLVGGPYNSAAECAANCGSSTSANSTMSGGGTGCCPCCQTPPSTWVIGISGGTGVFGIINGTWPADQIDGYSDCNASDPCTWIVWIDNSDGTRAYIIFGADGAGGLYAYCDVLDASSTVIANGQWWLPGTGCTSQCCGTHTLPLNSQWVWTAGGYSGAAAYTISLTGNC